MDVDIKNWKTIFYCCLLIGAPMLLIFLQNDTGSALVYLSLFIVLYREGMSNKIVIFGISLIILIIMTLLIDKFVLMGIITIIIILYILLRKKRFKNLIPILAIYIVTIGLIFVVDFAFENVLEPHQRTRINVLLGKEIDIRGAGYNVHQSKIAIGSGGFWGKGFLKGTQTKFNFVPEQSTDFIFCTVGEEWGFLGSSVVIILYLFLLIRLIILSERQRSRFSRIYGYGVASILFFHFAINIGMTIGLLPVIGIPLPFFSYGGSSLWAFTILLFIFIKLDAKRLELV